MQKRNIHIAVKTKGWGQLLVEGIEAYICDSQPFIDNSWTGHKFGCIVTSLIFENKNTNIIKPLATILGVLVCVGSFLLIRPQKQEVQ